MTLGTHRCTATPSFRSRTLLAMACRGMFFALTEDQEAALMATRDDSKVRVFVEEVEMGDCEGEPPRRIPPCVA
ncbi:hypothetical protein EDD30_1036 [Couchioplanes caeruleus]|uniref:Uncharacterized protein n=3 Tax=Couchioplanes caeruleus TaxID=56438 RepID=A0A1K0GM00_9ACTN|nr:hypothetical protein BG844_22605 [Couchioplanes caeruleus subsp. caeruleus]ROP28293.1 hypothetical protein EDD30_1036 [Couchioplanes caeruleus]